jgi:hypothetical protein
MLKPVLITTGATSISSTANNVVVSVPNKLWITARRPDAPHRRPAGLPATPAVTCGGTRQ